MASMKTAAQLIAEIDRAQAARARLAAEQEEQSAKMLAWLFAELNSAAVRVRYNEPDVKLVAGDGPGFVIDRYGKLLCRVSGRNGGVRIVRVPIPKAEEFTDYEGALRSVLELLHEDCRRRPQDDRDPLEQAHERRAPVGTA
jgi:hypothetical protein